MTIQVALRPRNAAGLNSALQAMYTKGSSSYHHWLAAGRFDALYAPAAAQRSAVAKFLTSAGLKVAASPSPFLVRATGSSAQVSAAFRTTLRTYKDKKGTTYYQNSSPVKVPAAMTGYVQGVTGLTNTIRDRSMVQRPDAAVRPAAKPGAKPASCEEPYPTVAQQFANVNSGTPIPFGFGAGPGCQGLTPRRTTRSTARRMSARAARAGASASACSSCRRTSIPTSAPGRRPSTERITPRRSPTSTSMAARSARCARRATRARRRSTDTQVTSRSTPISRCSSRSRQMLRT